MLTRSPTSAVQPEEPHSSATAVGFYSVVELESIGYCGGYLVLNSMAQPLEFHCSLPIRPDRAHQIFYGATLESYLINQHLGPPLISKAKTPVAFVWVNQRTSLRLDHYISRPVGLLDRSGQTTAVTASNPQWQVPMEEWIQQRSMFDWLEPFERIQTALNEAHSTAAN